ncbi:Aste57867_24092 [Aphanomyces stellatus]|uniref:Aste57867_24092 protein n=1 Tax=Aphanomyces stellatus TaxID=120398 RepID=A0A485LQ87_9STRA|nr:hypothetical protein As57867_024019 [Aphanomyces stellatus]VFU00734.1 Aste57867_24092 [Aphanomyces stellatus]
MCTRVYVGNLPMNIRTRELDDLFYKYGRIRDIDIKQPSRPPAFAFIEFEDSRDADDAIRGRDGYEFDGQRLRVERTTGGGRRSGGGGDRDRDRDRERDTKGFGRNLMGSGKYSVDVTGLPDSCAWQDLKDFMRKIGDVIFAKVDKKGGGFVEFTNREDMLRAVSKFDDTELKTRTETATIRVKEAHYLEKKGGRSRSRSRSPRRRRSYSRSYSRSRSRSSSRGRSRSKSHEKKHNDDKKDDIGDDEKKDEKKDDEVSEETTQKDDEQPAATATATDDAADADAPKDD